MTKEVFIVTIIKTNEQAKVNTIEQLAQLLNEEINAGYFDNAEFRVTK